VASEIDLHKTAQKNLDKSGTKDKLEKAINKISSKYREAVILRFYEEKEYEEIAEILHVPIGTVGTYISRAKKELKEQLSDINIEDYL
jgi:RNA polymerase sigma-70 factor (ECF subfamily)